MRKLWVAEFFQYKKTYDFKEYLFQKQCFYLILKRDNDLGYQIAVWKTQILEKNGSKI